jgi:hypothetical protein
MIRGEEMAAGFLLNVTGPPRSKEVGETAEAGKTAEAGETAEAV